MAGMTTIAPPRKLVARKAFDKAVDVSAPVVVAHSRDASISGLIVRRLQEDIVLGRRHPRERLVEQDLSVDFKTHRSDVRLALFELEKKGIVQRIPNRGAIVRDLSPREVTEIYGVREELEVMAVRILPLPVSKSDLVSIEALQREHDKAVEAEDLLAVFYSNVRFHRVFYGLCGNNCLIETIEHLAQKVCGIRSYAYTNPAALGDARRDHIEMIAALRDSRRDDLIGLIKRHLKPAAQAYIRAYRQRFGEASI